MIVCVVLACVLKVAGWLPAELTWIYLCLTLAIGLLGVGRRAGDRRAQRVR